MSCLLDSSYKQSGIEFNGRERHPSCNRLREPAPRCRSSVNWRSDAINKQRIHGIYHPSQADLTFQGAASKQFSIRSVAF